MGYQRCSLLVPIVLTGIEFVETDAKFSEAREELCFNVPVIEEK
jgi:hypothetical protein